MLESFSSQKITDKFVFIKRFHHQKATLYNRSHTLHAVFNTAQSPLMMARLVCFIKCFECHKNNKKSVHDNYIYVYDTKPNPIAI